MLKRSFKWEPDHEYGAGWVPTFVKDADPVFRGNVAAHDVLEHFPNCIGGLEGEMMAFGQMHYVRRWSDFGNGFMHYDICSSQRSDIEHFLSDRMRGEGVTCDDPGDWNADDLYDFDDHQMRLQIRKAIVGAIKEAIHGESDEPFSLKARELRNLPHDLTDRLLGWMVRGYRAAKRRWERLGLDESDAQMMFEDLAQQWERVTKHDPDDYDTTIEVTVDLKAQRVNVERVEPEYAFDDEEEFA